MNFQKIRNSNLQIDGNLAAGSLYNMVVLVFISRHVQYSKEYGRIFK